MPQHHREPNTAEGEYVVKVRRKKKRKDSASELRRATYKVTRDWNFFDILKKIAVFLLVLAVFAGIAYEFLAPPGN